MITDKPKFKNLKSEGLKRVVEKLNNNDKITNKHFNVVDAVEYTKEYFNKGSEQDEQININNKLITERITYESNETEILKYQLIYYGLTADDDTKEKQDKKRIRKELIYKRQK